MPVVVACQWRDNTLRESAAIEIERMRENKYNLYTAVKYKILINEKRKERENCVCVFSNEANLNIHKCTHLTRGFSHCVTATSPQFSNKFIFLLLSRIAFSV